LPSTFARLQRDKRHGAREPGTGDGAVHAGIPGRDPFATKARQEIGEIETTAIRSAGGIWLKTKNVTIIGPFHRQARAKLKNITKE